MITFNQWMGKRATLSSVVHQINEQVDKRMLSDFSKMSLWDENHFHTIINNVNNFQSTDYFYSLKKDSMEVESAWGNELNISPTNLAGPT